MNATIWTSKLQCAYTPCNGRLEHLGNDKRGLLRCTQCGEDYPIIGGIPRLVLPSELLSDELSVRNELRKEYGPA